MIEALIDIRPLLAILVSAIALPLIWASAKKPNLREFWSYFCGVVMFLIIISMLPFVISGGVVEYTVLTVLPGIEFKLRADALGMLFAMTASFLWIVTTTYSIGYMRGLNEHAQTRFFACFAIAVSSAIGVAFSANLFTLYLFYEILSVMTYPLVAHNEDAAAWDGGKKYMIYLLGLSKTALLAAIVITYMTTGTMDFAPGGIFTTSMPSMLVILSFALFIIGFGKAGLMPFHNWLPSAMVAPTPVSALLHAVAVVKVGVFSVVKVLLFIFGVDVLAHFSLGTPLAVVASFTIITASVIALTKNDLKARLAYSTVSQLSYIVLGVALLNPNGITGSILHIGNHAFSKITLFFCAGSIYVASKIKKIDELNGIAKKMPYTMAAFTIGSFSMIGVPVAAGFTTKWYLALGAVDSGSTGFLIVLLVSTVLNAAYFMPIIFRAYFKEPAEGVDLSGVREHPWVALPLSLTAVISLVIGVYPDLFLSLIERVVS